METLQTMPAPTRHARDTVKDVVIASLLAGIVSFALGTKYEHTMLLEKIQPVSYTSGAGPTVTTVPLAQPGQNK